MSENSLETLDLLLGDVTGYGRHFENKYRF